MLVKVQSGRFDPAGGATEPDGLEIWSADQADLTAAALVSCRPDLELGTWYALETFANIVEGPTQTQPGIDGFEARSAITTAHAGVGDRWEATIEVVQTDAVLMLCRAVAAHARRLKGRDALWVRVE